MNIRQQKYKKNRLLGMGQRNAAIAAGYSEQYAKTCQCDKKSHPSMADVIERMGLTDKKIVEFALEGMKAQKIISANITYGDADEKTNDFIEVPDWVVRHKFFETLLKLAGKLSDKIDGKTVNNSIIIIRRDGNQTKTVSGRVHIQQEEVSGDGVKLGDGEVSLRDTSLLTLQRADS